MIRKPLSNQECDALDARITGLATLAGRDAEQELADILHPLLQQEGFKFDRAAGRQDHALDFQAVRAESDGTALVSETLGVQSKFYANGKAEVPRDAAQKLIAAALNRRLDRALLISNAEFSATAKEEVARDLPVAIELMGLRELTSWVARLRSEEDDAADEAYIIMRDVSERWARAIAANPSVLAHMEWRDVERLMAEVFDGLGFGVTLTPPSKDGGKDVILTCTVQGRRAVYYVEIKHWRSATRPGQKEIGDFLKVVVDERKDGGLFFSTYGYTDNAFQQLTTFDKTKLRFGDQEKIVSYCRTYVKAKAGLWSPPRDLSRVIWPQ